MIAKALCGGALALALLSWPISTASKQSVNYPSIRQVDCAMGKGTAFLTTKGWVSVEHVTSGLVCTIDGQPIGATPEKDLDFSRIDHPRKGPAYKIDCGGFKPGHWYHAIGFAGGYEWQTMTRHLATFKKSDEGLVMLLGSPTVIPGMSGGPILNSAGEVVGVVNAYSKIAPVSFSRELKDTSLCSRP